MTSFVLYKNTWISKSDLTKANSISDKDCTFLLSKKGFLVRNTYNWDKDTPSPFWYIIKDDFNGIEELPTKVRNQVRKSLKTYKFLIVSHEDMLKYGYELYNKSREKYNDSELQVSREWWEKRLCDKQQEFWIGFDKDTGKPASFAINTIFDDYVDYSTMGISPDFPNNTYPMYGLIYEMNRYYLEEIKVPFVCDGARSITEHSNIQPFLEEKFKFRKAYCDLQVFYKPWLGFAVKLLFPFRRMIKNKKVTALLRQEAWSRGLEE